MTVGQDSYVTVAEADAYITSHYRSNNANRTRWMALEQEDKEVLLVQACEEIDHLPFRGRKSVSSQRLAWPRLPIQYGYEQTPPERVKSAQIELALWLSDDEARAQDAQRQELQEQGVTQFSIGDLSETYDKTASARGDNASAALACPKSRALLAIYLQGGYEVR